MALPRVVFVLVALTLPVAFGFYLPGVAPHAYVKDEAIPLLVNRLDSNEDIIPFDYYHFDFCEPGEDPSTGEAKPHIGAAVSENLGQILLGERIRHSPYIVKLHNSVMCRPICKRDYDVTDGKSKKSFQQIYNAIRKEYMQHWILDNLPSVECTGNCRGGDVVDTPIYRTGFPVGCSVGGSRASICTNTNLQNIAEDGVFINNHVDITVRYHESIEFTGARIVGFQINPRSIKQDSVASVSCARELPAQPWRLDKEHPKMSVVYTYSLVFEPSMLKWASRWDAYLSSAEDTRIHWFSIVNSLVIVVFLSGMLAVVLLRTVHRDIARYNQAEGSEDAAEEFGWKLVHGDVFRAPARGMLLSVLLGSGAQLTLMAAITLFFACLGFLSPATRGGLATAMVVLWVLLGTPAGYVAARLYKTFGGERWKSNVLLTALLVPGTVFTIFFVLNLVLWAKQSSAAVPFGTLIALLALWSCISVPLTFVGAYMGFKKPALEYPIRTNQIPRQIPPQPFYTRAWPCILAGGVLPFGCVFIQLFFILTSIWSHKFYYVFGFLALVVLILAVTTVESTVLLCYLHLCAEDYRWWWRAFITSGSSAVYFLAYAGIFYVRRMEVEGATNLVLYGGYTLIMTLIFGLITATIGFFGCFYFVHTIYGVIKVD